MALPSFTRHWLWFGTRGYETDVPMPASGADMSRPGYEVAIAYLNGGQGGNSSKSGAKVYSFAYNDALRSELLPILDFAEGAYDTHDGVNLIYFVEPTAADYNAAPQNWAQASLGGEDGMPLWWDNRPTLIATAANQYRYPARTARYRADGPSQSLYIPVPPGYVAWVGAHGSAGGAAGVRVTPVVGDVVTGTPTTLSMLSVITDLRVNASFPRDEVSLTGIVIDMVPTGLLRNLAPNPSFETDVQFTGCFHGTSGSNAVAQQAGGKSGASCARATWTVANTVVGGAIYEQIPVEAGKTYSFSTYYRTSNANRVQPQISWLDASGAIIGSVSGTSATTTAAPAWSAAPIATILNQLAPTGAVTARFAVAFVSGSGAAVMPIGGWIEMDAIQVNEGATVQTYMDGNSTGWEWIGTVNDSVSRQSPDTLQLTSLIVQLFPIGVTPPRGGWLSGQGHSGCQFLGGKPKLIVTSAALDRVQLSAKLTETGNWI